MDSFQPSVSISEGDIWGTGGQGRCASPVCTAEQAWLLPCAEQGHQEDTFSESISLGESLHLLCHQEGYILFGLGVALSQAPLSKYTPFAVGSRGIRHTVLTVVYQTFSPGQEEPRRLDSFCSGLNSGSPQKICPPGASDLLR